MKKYKKYVLPVALLLVLVVVLCAIVGSCNNKKQIVGEWQLSYYKDDGKKVTELKSDEIWLYKFESDGTGMVTLPEEGDRLLLSFKWKLNGKKLILDTFDEELSEFKVKISGNKLRLIPARAPEITRVYKRVK